MDKITKTSYNYGYCLVSMNSGEIDLGKESKKFIKRENKKLIDSINNISKDKYKTVIIVGIISIISAVVGGGLGACIQSGVFNPPPESNVDILLHGINTTQGFYIIQIRNYGNTPSDDIIFQISFHQNITVDKNEIRCNKFFKITESNDNSIYLTFNMLAPTDYITLSVQFDIDGDVPSDIIYSGTLAPIGEKSKNLLDYHLREIRMRV